MDRNREARRTTVNGLSRRRHRTSSLRDSPEEDVPMELRDRGGARKDRDRSRSKRRRGERREEGGEESSEESVNDEEDEYENDGGGAAAAMSNHHHRKILTPSSTTKVLRPWKPADVPRKARSASAKRSLECWVSGSGVEGEQATRRNSTSPAPISPPSSSNASHRKKMKPNGPKLRPPKSSAKTSSSNPEELLEIAEVLYGMKTQAQGPSKKEIVGNDLAKFDVNKSSSDAKSRVSSPISNSSVAPLLSAVLPQNSISSDAHISAVAPKRKRPRQVPDNLGSLSVGQNPISSTTKVEIDLPPKTEICSPNTERNPGSAAENGIVSHDFACSQAIPPPSEQPAPPSNSARPEPGGVDVGLAKEEPVTSLEKESPVVRPHNDHEASIEIKANLTISEVERQKEEKFEIDLMMVPPPQLRSSPDRGGINFVAAVEQKPVLPKPNIEMGSMTKDHEDVMAVKNGKDDAGNAEPELKMAKVTAEGGEFEKLVVSKERNIDQLDLEKLDRVMGSGSSASGNKSNPSVQKQQPHTEKTVQSTSLPMPMSVASWPSGLPPMGTYMAPLQGVVSMDGNTVSPSPIQPLFSHPRPKRCATHSYIARNIHYLQQFMKMNPFWPATAAGSTPLFGAKPCNLNAVPSAELHGNSIGRTVNSVQDQGSGLTIFPGHSAKDKSSQATNIADAQRKQQILLQQALPPGAPPSNMLHGPAFIFPLNQQQAAVAVAAAASVRPGSVKSPTGGGNVASTTASIPASVSGSATAPPAATAVGFNYPNAPVSETQYLAILQNNAYPFPIPAVGAPSAYRGTHAQPMPYFNSSFYSSQMIHPSQLQQQLPSTQPQNTTTSGGSSSSHKHLQSQQQRPQSSGTAYGGNGSGNLHSFPAPKNRPSQASPPPQQPNQHQVRHVEALVGSEDSPSTADSRISRHTMSVYGQSFPVPIHPQNFALMISPPLALTGAGGGGNQGDKKQQHQLQQQSSKGGVESHPPLPFAMSFASMNGVIPPPGMDISSMAQNNALLQSMPEATRQNYQIIAAAQAAQQKKNFRASEDGKTGGGSDSSNVDEEKKNLPGKSITFSRPDLVDSSTSAPPRTTSRSAMVTMNGSNSQLQAQIQYQQQQMMQLQKHQQQQQQQLMAAAWNKSPPTSNGSVYGDHLASSASAGTKFPNGLSSIPQNLVQSTNNSPAQSPQWKNPSRTTNSQVPSSLASSTTSSLKSVPQQQARTQQNHTQISFGGTQKSSTAPQGQQAPSPPLMAVGSPTTSISKGGAGGSPRTMTAPSAGNKATQPSTLSSQPPKNSASVPTRKSSPVGNRNAPSILGNSHITPLSNTKPQMQQQQQQLPKQQPQLFFSHAYMQAQAPHSNGASSTTSATSGYYLQRRRSEQPQQSQPPPQGCSSAASSTGMLSLCPPVTLAITSTSDAKAVVAAASAAAAAASNMKGGGGLTSQGTTHHSAQSSGSAHPLLPPGFSYIPAVPSPVQAKPVEQKQSAGKRAT